MNNTRDSKTKESLWQKITRPRGPFFETQLQDQSTFLKTLAAVLGPLILAVDVLIHILVAEF
jgi:hypothetical protein